MVGGTSFYIYIHIVYILIYVYVCKEFERLSSTDRLMINSLVHKELRQSRKYYLNYIKNEFN